MHPNAEKYYVANLLDQTVTCVSLGADACVDGGSLVATKPIVMIANWDPITGPTTVAIDRVELKIPVEVERGLFSIKWKLPPINKNAHVPPTKAINGIAIHHSVTKDNPTKTNVVQPILILNFVILDRSIFVAITFIKINAVKVFAT